MDNQIKFHSCACACERLRRWLCTLLCAVCVCFFSVNCVWQTKYRPWVGRLPECVYCCTLCKSSSVEASGCWLVAQWQLSCVSDERARCAQSFDWFMLICLPRLPIVFCFSIFLCPPLSLPFIFFFFCVLSFGAECHEINKTHLRNCKLCHRLLQSFRIHRNCPERRDDCLCNRLADGQNQYKYNHPNSSRAGNLTRSSESEISNYFVDRRHL